jgi:hypothetical protein
MMKTITDKYPELSAQFGKTAKTIEFHDFFDNCDAETIVSLQETFDDVFKNRDYSYQIIEGTAKNSLLKKPQYAAAIKNAGFQFLEKIIETVRTHDTMFNCQ